MPASRIRPREPISESDGPSPSPKAYRIHFSCENQGRYFRSSKRKIQWSFGLTDPEALRRGKKGRECRGEEHSVALVWSLKSGKTRVFWNGQDISNLFRDCRQAETLDFSWKSRSGETLHMIAHAEPKAGVRQYDLLVDGESYFSLPLVSDIGVGQVEREESEMQVCDERIEQVESTSMSDLTGECRLDDLTPEAMDFRLSMVGLNTAGTESSEIVDELHSNLYSPMLENLRQQITECLPQTEEMVSRAIIHAFFVDTDSQQSNSRDTSLSDSCGEADQNQVEADSLWEAAEFMVLSGIGSADDRDSEDVALSFMQKKIDSMFVRVRNEDLSSNAASRILLHVGAVLGLKFANSISADTLILEGLAKQTTDREIYDALILYGEVEASAVVKGTDFGICRFRDSASAKRAYADSQKNGVVIFGVVPSIEILSESWGEGSHHNPLQRRHSLEEKKLDDNMMSSLYVMGGGLSPFRGTNHKQSRHKRSMVSIHSLSSTDSEHEIQLVRSPDSVTDSRVVVSPAIFDYPSLLE